jgi:hypothetical protein
MTVNGAGDQIGKVPSDIAHLERVMNFRPFCAVAPQKGTAPQKAPQKGAPQKGTAPQKGSSAKGDKLRKRGHSYILTFFSFA